MLPGWSREQSRIGARLFRHYRSRPEGVNVFLLSDGTITESEPDGTRVVWSPNDRTGDAINAIWVVVAWYGGHDNYEVTAAQAQLLAANGYTVVDSTPVVDPPTITSLSPSSGIVGATVAIIGTNLSNATTVTVDGVSVSFTVVLSTRLTFTAPSHADGVVTVEVTTPYGTDSESFTFSTPTPGSAPVISVLTPSSGASGASVVLTGTSFTGATSVTFGGSSASFSVNSDSTITATAPTHADGTVTVTVTTQYGSDSDSFTYTTSAPSDAHPGNDLLLEDGSFLLLEDGTSTLLLES